MEEKNMPENVPYIVHEGAMARNERLVKRLIICIAISVIMLFASNAAWLYSWMQYDYSDTTVSMDTGSGGDANYIGQDGDITNGSNSSQEKDATPEER